MLRGGKFVFAMKFISEVSLVGFKFVCVSTATSEFAEVGESELLLNMFSKVVTLDDAS